MCDLQTQYLQLKPEIDQAIDEVISSTQFIKGEVVGRFEHALADYLGVKHCIGVGNGTDALMIALMALGLEEGDEVICPSFTFVATAEAAGLLKLVPVPVDVCENTMTIDPEAIEKAITPKTRAIIPVHLFGLCADMERVMEIANRHHLYVVEDTAQAIGADWIDTNGCHKKAGTIGHIGCTSFFPSKNLGCYGDGGALFTNDDQLAERIRMIANHGAKQKYHHEIIGVNSRLDSIQAAVLMAKLPHLDEFNNARRQAAEQYNTLLAGVQRLKTPATPDYSTHVFHQYTLRIEGSDCEQKLKEKRDWVMEELKKQGIPSMIYYPVPIHLQPAYKASSIHSCPVSERLSNSVISLPMHTSLTTNQIQEITCQLLRLVQAQ